MAIYIQAVSALGISELAAEKPTKKLSDSCKLVVNNDGLCHFGGLFTRMQDILNTISRPPNFHTEHPLSNDISIFTSTLSAFGFHRQDSTYSKTEGIALVLYT